MLPTGPHLVTNWLGCVLAGLEPLVLQYPTKKQSGDYLSSSIGNTVGLAGIAVIIADNRSHPFAAATGATVVAQEVLASLADGATDNYSIDSFAIVQLSSGTTGHRKAIRFQRGSVAPRGRLQSDALSDDG
jgi:acyl-CoA synthetase (AMP-forming)/AMP-acid ligase II